MSFRLVPSSVTLNDLEQHNGPYIAWFHRIRVRCRRETIIRPTSVSKATFDMTILIRSACGLDGRVHFNDGEFSSGV